jgi:hypothetical protein
MIIPFPAFALLAISALTVSAAAQTSANTLNLEDRTALRCAAAFAIVADGQAQGDKEALAYPAMGTRGREFFVRTSARVMDNTGIDRAAVAAVLQQEALALRSNGETRQIMPACLLLLGASGI